MMNVKHVRYLAAAAAVGFATMSFSAPSGAGGLDIGGLVGGTIGGTLGALGGTSGESYSGTSDGVSAKAGASIGYSGVGAKASIGGIKTKAHVTLYKKKLNANAKLFIGKHGHHKYGKLVKVTAVVGSKPLNTKAKILVGQVAKAKVAASLGYKTNVLAKVAVADLAKLKIGVNIGDDKTGGNPPGGNNGTPPTTGGSSPGAMASSFRDLSDHDQYVMTKKCSAVLAMPSRYDSDMVALCRIIATL
jgi:hypothetical protein